MVKKTFLFLNLTCASIIFGGQPFFEKYNAVLNHSLNAELYNQAVQNIDPTRKLLELEEIYGRKEITQQKLKIAEDREFQEILTSRSSEFWNLKSIENKNKKDRQNIEEECLKEKDALQKEQFREWAELFDAKRALDIKHLDETHWKKRKEEISSMFEAQSLESARRSKEFEQELYRTFGTPNAKPLDAKTLEMSTPKDSLEINNLKVKEYLARETLECSLLEKLKLEQATKEEYIRTRVLIQKLKNLLKVVGIATAATTTYVTLSTESGNNIRNRFCTLVCGFLPRKQK